MSCVDDGCLINYTLDGSNPQNSPSSSIFTAQQPPKLSPGIWNVSATSSVPNNQIYSGFSLVNSVSCKEDIKQQLCKFTNVNSRYRIWPIRFTDDKSSNRNKFLSNSKHNHFFLTKCLTRIQNHCRRGIRKLDHIFITN